MKEIHFRTKGENIQIDALLSIEYISLFEMYFVLHSYRCSYRNSLTEKTIPFK